MTTPKFFLRFDFPKKPGDEIPKLPPHLDELSDADLMSLYSQMVSWVNYAKAEVVQAEVIEENTLSALRQTEAMALLEQSLPSGSEATSSGTTARSGSRTSLLGIDWHDQRSSRASTSCCARSHRASHTIST